MKTKTKTYRIIEKDGKKKKRRNLNIVEHRIWKKKRKKERTYFKNRQYIDWLKKKRKLNIFELRL